MRPRTLPHTCSAISTVAFVSLLSSYSGHFSRTSSGPKAHSWLISSVMWGATGLSSCSRIFISPRVMLPLV